jgi:N-acetylmuramic acid 6-phosphate etherase
MQSSTILLAVAGMALYYHNSENETIENDIDLFINFWNSTDISFIENYIIKETEYYTKGEYLLYETDSKLGITVITDTTERSPTFSLYPFENIQEKDANLSLCYLYMPECKTSKKAWESLLWRDPRTLEWPDINGIASGERLLGFDFSSSAYSRREKLRQLIIQHRFKILDVQEGIKFELDDETKFFHASFPLPIFKHLVLKMILNTHSTLIMGRLGRYEGNVMTFLRASNNKLIDRAIRYIDLILKTKNLDLTYSELAHAMFEMIEKTPADQSIVLATVNEIVSRNEIS